MELKDETFTEKLDTYLLHYLQ